MEKEIRRLAPFHHDVELPFGLRTCPPDLVRRPIQQTRLRDLTTHAFPALLEACGGSLKGLRVLDVACNCGGFSIQAHRLGAAYVLGIDVVDRYVEQARFLTRALGLENLEFRKLDVEKIDEAGLAPFDVVFCFGLLYHLTNPVRVLEKLAGLTRRVMLLDTSLMPTWLDKRPLWCMTISTEAADLSRPTASTALWRDKNRIQFRPTASAVITLLRFLQFEKVEHLKPRLAGLNKLYHIGRRGTFMAVRHPGVSATTGERAGETS